MAAGANLGEKLFGMVKTIGPVFQSYAPGLGLLDLAVGVAGAVILYFVVQSKIKNARKFRRDMEYGSARWGTEADIGVKYSGKESVVTVTFFHLAFLCH